MSLTIKDDKLNSCNGALDIGTIEKLYPKYGFIKCLGKNSEEKSLFFHSSATMINYSDLEVGDCVKYERIVTNGKPLATNVQRTTGEIIEGTIVKMPRKIENGSISYEVNGESFFVNFDKSDVAEKGRLRAKDEVTFEKVEKNGKASALYVRRKFNKQLRVQGIVTAVKENFGFIDRSDIVKEIYFNLSALPQEVDIQPGLELEFNVKHLRNGKEEAVNIKVLKKGTVKFVEVIDTVIYGTLLRSTDSKRTSTGDVLMGNISYVGETDRKVFQIPFGERDKKNLYSLLPGDIVAFKIAIDCRDQLQRASEVELCLESFPSCKETRHMGVIKMFDGSAGLIEPDLAFNQDEDMLVAFKAKEWVSTPQYPKLQKFLPITYTPLQNMRTSTNKNGISTSKKAITTAIRILPASESEVFKHLKLYPSGSVRGTITTSSLDDNELGIIIGNFPNGEKRSVAFTQEDVSEPHKLKVGVEVVFGCLDREKSNTKYLPPTAFDIWPVDSTRNDTRRTGIDSKCAVESIRKHRSKTLPDNKILPSMLVKRRSSRADGDNDSDYDDEDESETRSENLRGWVVILKDKFGLIESEDHKMLYRFNPLGVRKGINIQLDSPVEFIASNRRRLAESVTLASTDLLCDGFSDNQDLSNNYLRIGEVIKPLLLGEGSEYPGIIREHITRRTYTYSMKSLISFRTKLSVNDRVLFQVSSFEEGRAYNVSFVKLSARVKKISDDSVQFRLVSSNFSIDEQRKSQLLMPIEFEVDIKLVDNVNLEDLMELTLNLDEKTNVVTVEQVKPIKPLPIEHQSILVASQRKTFKTTDENIPKILHIRAPRLPVTDSTGFTLELRTPPVLEYPVL